MERRVTVKESGNGYICKLEVQDDGGEKVAEREMLVVGNDQACLGETIQELMKYRIRDRKKKVTFLAGCHHGKAISECPICNARASKAPGEG